MTIAPKHAPTLFLVVMVFIMVVFMTMVLTLVNVGPAGFWHAWPRQFLLAFPVALPIAFGARIVATKVTARFAR